MEGAGQGKLSLLEQRLCKLSHASTFPMATPSPVIIDACVFLREGNSSTRKQRKGCSGVSNPILCSLWPRDHPEEGDSSSATECWLAFSFLFFSVVIT